MWLLDEIEKAHPEFVHLLLQMTDAGRLTLANGETLDLSRIYIVVTSNLGSAEILGREHLPFASLEKHVVRCIRRHLRPELLARFGKPYVFRPLPREIQAEIAAEHLTELMRWRERPCFTGVDNHGVKSSQRAARAVRPLPWIEAGASAAGVRRSIPRWSVTGADIVPVQPFSLNSASANCFGSNGWRSSDCSPTPMNLIGNPSSFWIATTIPPLLVPSSLVTTKPVNGTAL